MVRIPSLLLWLLIVVLSARFFFQNCFPGMNWKTYSELTPFQHKFIICVFTMTSKCNYFDVICYIICAYYKLQYCVHLWMKNQSQIWELFELWSPYIFHAKLTFLNKWIHMLMHSRSIERKQWNKLHFENLDSNRWIFSNRRNFQVLRINLKLKNHNLSLSVSCP